MSYIPIPPYEPSFKPVPNVTPFTYRDGVTMLKKVDGIIRYINRVVIPFVNETDQELADKVETDINNMITVVNNAIAQLETETDAKLADMQTVVDNAISFVNTSITNLTAYVDEQVQLIITDAIQVQDPVVAGIFANAGSATRIAADAIYSKKTEIPPAAQIAASSMHVASVTGESFDVTVNNAIAFASTNGISSIILESGSFDVNNSIVITNNINIYGSKTFLRTTGLFSAIVINNGVSCEIVINATYKNARPTYATVLAANALESFAGVTNFGNKCNIRGDFQLFRTGVRNARADVSDDFADNNTVNITHSNVDFGIIYFGQSNGRFEANGSYSAAAGSPDEPHNVYGTDYPALPSYNCISNAETTSGPGGRQVKIRRNSNAKSEKIIGSNCAGSLALTDLTGSFTSELIIGRNLIPLSWDGTNTLIEPIRTDSSITPVPKYFGIVDLEISSTISASQLRAVSCTEGNITFSTYTIKYSNDSTDPAAAITQISTGPSVFNSVNISNVGIGTGVIGLRFAGGSNHKVNSAPVITNCRLGIYVHDSVGTANIVMNRALIVASENALYLNARSGIVVGDNASFASGRYRRSVENVVPAEIVYQPSRQHWYSFIVNSTITISEFAIYVSAGAATATMEIGIATDSDCSPRNIITSGIVDTSSIGEKNVVLTQPVKLTPGRYWATMIGVNAAVTATSIPVAQLNPGATNIQGATIGAVLRRATDATALVSVASNPASSSSIPGLPLVVFKIV